MDRQHGSAALDVRAIPEIEPTPEETRRKHVEMLRGFGFETAIDTLLLDRLKLLEEAEIVGDELKAIEYGHRLNSYWNEQGSATHFSFDEMRTFQLSTIFTDIGKTGGKDFTPEQVAMVSGVFGIRTEFGARLKDLTLGQLFQESAVEMNDTPEHLSAVALSLGIDPETTKLRSFFDMHVPWTYSILKGTVPPEIALTASLHHLPDGYFPPGIVDIETGALSALGVDRPIGKEVLMVMMLDKYDASRTRGKKDHPGAIRFLREVTGKSAMFDRLPKKIHELFLSMVDDLEKALA